MALQIGQKRNIDYQSSGQDFINDLTSQTYWDSHIHSRNIFGNTGDYDYVYNYFQDCGFRLSSGTFSSAEVYYLTLQLKRQEQEIIFDIRLQRNDDCSIEDPYQNLKKCSLNKRVYSSDEYDYYDLVFTPDRTDVYNTIVFSINRQAIDILNNDGVDGKPLPRTLVPMDEEEGESFNYNFYSLNNLINSSQQKYWKKIGVQSRPGSLIVINKEPIRIGRSGIYELNNGTKITDFMIASGWDADEKVDPFLVDYVYQKSGG